MPAPWHMLSFRVSSKSHCSPSSLLPSLTHSCTGPQVLEESFPKSLGFWIYVHFLLSLKKHKLDYIYCHFIPSLSNRPWPKCNHVRGTDLCLSMCQVCLMWLHTVIPEDVLKKSHAHFSGIPGPFHCFTKPNNIFLPVIFFFRIFFSPFSFYQSQMLKKCLRSVV